MRFSKVQSIGNDFVLLSTPEVGERAWDELAKSLCARHFGVGSDGLLVVSPSGEGQIDLRMFNPDGTEDFCGNGLRCAAVYAVEQRWVGDSFAIRHGGQSVPTSVQATSVRTVLGTASFEADRVPCREPWFRRSLDFDGETLLLSSLTTGSTHTIVEVDELPETPHFKRVSQALEHHANFPERTSVIWMRVDDPTSLTIRIWERGAGETMGCGTGSSAAAVLHARNTGFIGTVDVHNPGGTVQVELAEGWAGPIAVTGAARVVFEGETDLGA